MADTKRRRGFTKKQNSNMKIKIQYQKLCAAAKAVFRGKSITLNTHIGKKYTFNNQ